ncbi:MAG: hypothetical protein AB1861_03385 [Cyanobacteriota bacterium]
MIEILKSSDGLYFGRELASGVPTGKVALLRIPDANESVGVFMRLNESYTEFLPLCGDTFPAGYYPPKELFTNWKDFSELHETKIMAWDLGNTPGIESQWVRSAIDEFTGAIT